MILMYNVLFTKTKNCILIEVPDLDILSEGKNMQDAILMARDAIGATILTLEDNGKKPPKMTKEINVKKGTFSNKGKTIVSIVDIDMDEYKAKYDNKMIRRNITIPHWLNEKAKKLRINVSKVLQEALKDKVAMF